MAEASTTAVWVERVEAWRASGERAEAFSRREGYAASTLRWWASRLKRETAIEASAAPSEVRLARVVREAAPVAATRRGAIVLEVADVRLAIEPGADRATLAMVLEVLGVGGTR